jgi:3-dehydroquinate dehydratase-2
MKIRIINGPNLNLLGKREPEIYGSQGFEEYLPTLKVNFPDLEVDYFQSNIEGELINSIQEAGFTYDGIILNAGAYTHTSVAIGDAVAAIFARETFRHHSFIAPHAKGIIAGLGLNGYQLAVQFLYESK